MSRTADGINVTALRVLRLARLLRLLRRMSSRERCASLGRCLPRGAVFHRSPRHGARTGLKTWHLTFLKSSETAETYI